MTQFCRLTLQELANALARAVQTDGYADIVEALNFVKDHDRAVLACWTLAGAAGAHVAVNAGEFGMGIDFGIGFNIFARQRF